MKMKMVSSYDNDGKMIMGFECDEEGLAFLKEKYGENYEAALQKEIDNYLANELNKE